MRVAKGLLGAFALLNGWLGGAVAEPVPRVKRAPPTVDLGYSVYQGIYDEVSAMNVFKGSVSQMYFWSNSEADLNE